MSDTAALLEKSHGERLYNEENEFSVYQNDKLGVLKVPSMTGCNLFECHAVDNSVLNKHTLWDVI